MADPCQFAAVSPGVWQCTNPDCGKSNPVRFTNAQGKPPRRECGPKLPPPRPAKPDPRQHEQELLAALPNCRHRGLTIIQDVPCKACGMKDELFDVYQCGIHGKCTLGRRDKPGTYKVCLACPDSEVDPSFPRMMPVPSPTDPMTPITAEISDVRNLLYHIYPTRKSDAWQWNVEQLRQRLPLFNGVRSIGVVTDEHTCDLSEVQDAFDGERIDHWISLPNDPKNREGVTFEALMETLPRDNSVTCYAHAKGVRHEAGSSTLKWADMLYRSTFDDWPKVQAALERFPIAGTFKRYGHFSGFGGNLWHFAGTFFWFRNADTFARNWNDITRDSYLCIEEWPSRIYKASEAACLFGDNAGDMYSEAEIEKWEHAANQITT